MILAAAFGFAVAFGLAVADLGLAAAALGLGIAFGLAAALGFFLRWSGIGEVAGGDDSGVGVNAGGELTGDEVESIWSRKSSWEVRSK